MKKVIKKIIDAFDRMVIKRFSKIAPKEIITALYRKVVEGSLQITTKEISVKKGKVRYTLFIVKDKNLQTRFNLGRH